MTDVAVRLEQLSARKRQLVERLLREKGASFNAFPLSFAQERLWFLDQLQPGSSAYNIATAFRALGALDAPVLARVLGEIVRRHEVLRSRFISVSGAPLASVDPEAGLRFQSVDLSSLAAARRAPELERVLRFEAARPFDLTRGGLLRATLIRLAEEEHVLLLTFHHIVTDGWSMEILLREVRVLYEAFAAGEASPLPALPIQYADYARWQREWLKSEQLQDHLRSVKARLAGAPPLLELPADRARPAVFDYRGGAVPFRLGKRLADGIEGLAQSSGATRFMALLAAFHAFLHRLTGQSDIVTGAPVANRNRAQTRDLIGFFVNLVVLRNSVHGRSGFKQLLAGVRETTLAAYTDQDVPFEMLVEELQPQRNLAHAPLFQVMLMLQSDAVDVVDFGDWRLEPVSFATAHARFDLTLALAGDGDGLSAAFEYSTALFDKATVRRFAGQLESLLAGMLAEPERPLAELPLLGPAARHQLLREWTDHHRDLPRTASIHGLFAERARRRPEAVALIFEGRCLSYGELARRSGDLAWRLEGLGAGPEKVVGVALRRGLELVVGLLGVLEAGAAYLPLDPDYPAERLRFILADARVAVLLETASAPAFAAVEGLPVVELGPGAAGDTDTAQSGAAQSDVGELADVHPAQAAYMIYTSGSTGRPKGVVVAHRQVINFFAGMDERLGTARPGTWLATTSISFDISVLELLYTVCRGARVVVQGESPRSAATVAPAPRARHLDFSLFYFASAHDGEGRDPYRLLLEGAKAADRLGFTAVWTPERHFHDFGGLYPNPATTGAAVAAVTERIQIRAGSVVMPLHHPVRVAEEWSVVDNISGGRVGVSFASGWHADDFVFAPDAYQDRRTVMEQGIDTVRRLWRGETCTLRGGAGDVEVRLFPRPVQDELPIWVTAGGSLDTFRLAGEIGGGVLTHLLGQNLDDLAEKIRVYRQARQQAGHQGPGHVALMLHTFVGDDLDSVRELVREPFSNYLRSASGLMRNLWRSLGRQDEIDAVDEATIEAFLGHAFERFFATSGLMGTRESCAQMIARLEEIGVDEAACLIDFGVDAERVLASLDKLASLQKSSADAAGATREEATPIAVQLERERITHLQCTPSLARLLVADPAARAGLQGLETWMLGGEALPLSLVEQVAGLTGAALHNMYGPTETTIWSATERLERPVDEVLIGSEIANTAIYILDAQGSLQPVGLPGELFIGGEGVARGYFARPSLTAQRFLPDPFSPYPGARIYATGDLARRRVDGKLDFLGRVDHQIKLHGHRIEPGEIEAVLRQSPAIAEAIVAVQDDGAGHERLVAYVISAYRPGTSGVRVSDERRRELLAERPTFTLPNGMIVSHYDQRQAMGLYREVFTDRSYLRHGITFNDGDVIFDVGGNVGFFSLFASQVCRPAKVYAFEPIPSNCALLRTNLALHDVPVEVFECGVADVAGEAEFVFYPHAAGLSSRASFHEGDLRELKTYAREGIASEHGETALSEGELEAALREHLRGERFTCRLRPLAEIIDACAVERIDLLKIDVEKSEVLVLRGIRDDQWPRIQQVMLEVHGHELLAETTAILEAWGFAVTSERLMEVEATTGDDAGLRVDMVYARRPDAPRSDMGGVVRTLDEGLALSFDDLRAYLGERLPEYMVPSIFMPLTAVPLTPNGKIDRNALPRPQTVQRSTRTEFVAPKTETESRLSTIWRDLLKVDRVGRNDNFFEIGGTSLLLVRVHEELQRAFERRLSLVDLFRHPTIASLAGFLSSEDKKSRTVEESRARMEKQSAALRTSDAVDRQRQFLANRRRRKQT